MKQPPIVGVVKWRRDCSAWNDAIFWNETNWINFVTMWDKQYNFFTIIIISIIIIINKNSAEKSGKNICYTLVQK